MVDVPTRHVKKDAPRSAEVKGDNPPKNGCPGTPNFSHFLVWIQTEIFGTPSLRHPKNPSPFHWGLAKVPECKDWQPDTRQPGEHS